ncbi:UPF0203 domain containing protein [Nitzschia inconspicua]|uniref:UPF0203 domain containing protein n=1 Tax=Nitzschia inconspicua TaxID=303405 RepID=A0A9K3LTY1_9STRA|nr:UPF0203 domain containing protein [Nitzschia inconspicua]KAG7367845.1 UPF0203 domain containing protein [Nitzschia inconspicua]
MGSTQSTPNDAPNSTIKSLPEATSTIQRDGDMINGSGSSSSSSDVDGVKDEKKATTTKKHKQPPTTVGLTGVALIEHKCRKKKRAWGACVKQHYEQKFLPGQSLEPEEADCDDLFESYRRCYMKGLLKQRQEKGMEPPKEGTMLHEFMEEEGMLDSEVGKNKNNK